MYLLPVTLECWDDVVRVLGLGSRGNDSVLG